MGLYYAFSEKPRWCSTEQVCQEVKCKTLNNPEDWMLFYTRPYIFDCTPAKAEQVLCGSRIPKVYPQLVLLTYKETHHPRGIHCKWSMHFNLSLDMGTCSVSVVFNVGHLCCVRVSLSVHSPMSAYCIYLFLVFYSWWFRLILQEAVCMEDRNLRERPRHASVLSAYDAVC